MNSANAYFSSIPNNLTITAPDATDGVAVHDLVQRCPPLDSNSLYCNLLQCTHFAATSALARFEDAVVGFVSGYRPPAYDDTYFVWQVAVDGAARGRGLAKGMIFDVLARAVCRNVSYLHTSVTATNAASRKMFEGLAENLDAPVIETVMFDAENHFQSRNDTELLLKIGPFDYSNPA